MKDRARTFPLGEVIKNYLVPVVYNALISGYLGTMIIILYFYMPSFLQTQFGYLGLQFVPSAANFVLVKVGDGQRVCAEMQKQGVIVRPMGGYQLPEFIRISVGTPAENNRCIETLKKVLR